MVTELSACQEISMQRTESSMDSQFLFLIRLFLIYSFLRVMGQKGSFLQRISWDLYSQSTENIFTVEYKSVNWTNSIMYSEVWSSLVRVRINAVHEQKNWAFKNILTKPFDSQSGWDGMFPLSSIYMCSLQTSLTTGWRLQQKAGSIRCVQDWQYASCRSEAT